MPVPVTSIYTRTDGIVPWHVVHRGGRRPPGERRGARHAHRDRRRTCWRRSPSPTGWPSRSGRWRPFRPPLLLRPWYPRAGVALARRSERLACTAILRRMMIVPIRGCQADPMTREIGCRRAAAQPHRRGDERRADAATDAEDLRARRRRDRPRHRRPRASGAVPDFPLEAAMAAQYDVSRSSLREALRILEVQGLIRLKPGPGGGPVVGVVEAANLARTASLYFHLGGATYRDLIETQALLEPLCAVGRGRQPGTTGGDGAVPRAGAARRPRALPPRDRSSFHRAIYELAANPVLRLLTEAITQMVTSHVLASTDPVELHAGIVAEHAHRRRRRRRRQRRCPPPDGRALRRAARLLPADDAGPPRASSSSGAEPVAGTRLRNRASRDSSSLESADNHA